MHHRIVFVAKRDDVTYEHFHLGWQMVHGHLLTPTVNLRGYVQNRPVVAQWGRGLYDGVAELWYETPELEQEAFDSHQSKVIRQHEHDFMVEDRTFSALVREEVLIPGAKGTHRVLAFEPDHGRNPDAGAVADLLGPRLGAEGRSHVLAATRLHLDETEPKSGARSLLSIWTDSEPHAFALKDALGGESLVLAPAPIVIPPLWPWTAQTPPEAGAVT